MQLIFLICPCLVRVRSSILSSLLALLNDNLKSEKTPLITHCSHLILCLALLDVDQQLPDLLEEPAVLALYLQKGFDRMDFI